MAKAADRADDPDAPARFDLHRHLPHLLRRAHFEAEGLFPAVYGDAVTSRQLALLVAIAQQPGLSQSELAQRIGIDLNTCSDLVARMAGKALIERRRSEADGRSYCLFLSADGEQIKRQGVALAGTYRDAVARRLSAEEQAQLVALLRRMLGLDD